jgi:plastocyanin
MRTAFVAACLVTLATGSWSCGGSSNSGNPTQPSGPAAQHVISVIGERGAQSFNPNPATVSMSQTVAWRNTDGETHHILLNDGSIDTGEIPAGATSRTFTMSVNGANYHCTIHPTMVGSINQSTGEPPPCSGQYCP